VDDFPLVTGGTCDLDEVLDGLTLTHRLGDEERGQDRLLVGTDLDPIALAEVEVPDGLEVPVAGAEPGRYDRSHDWTALVLPAGVLPDATAVAVRWTADGLTFEGLDDADLPAPDPVVGDRLLDTLRILRRHEAGIDPAQLVLEARVRYPLLFAEPQAPLGELLASVGVVDHLAYGLFLPDEDVPDHDAFDGDDLDDEDDDLLEHLREDHLLDDRLAGAVVRFQTAVLEAVNHVLRRLVERYRELPEDTDLEAVVDDGRDGPLVRASVLGGGVLGGVPGGLPGDGDLGGVLGEDVVREDVVPALVAALEDDDATAALVEDVLGDDQASAGAVLAFLDLAGPELRRRRAKGNAAWLRARALELVADDHAEAERELRRAHDLGAHASATFDLARYLSDRGQAGAALGLLRQLSGPDVADWQELLEPYAAPGPTAAGRNDPCPCGSGRKHKACCQPRNGWPLQERLEWVWDKVTTFATVPPGRELLLAVARPLRSIGVSDTGQPVVTCLALFEGGLLDEFCEVRGSLLPADELELLRVWSRDTRAGLYEVVEIGAGDEVTLLDLLRGERHTFDDPAIAEAAEVGAAGLGWFVEEPDGSHRPILGLNAVPDAWREPLLELLADDPELDGIVDMLRRLAGPTRLATTDGEPLRFVTRVLEVDDPDAAWAALTSHLEEHEDGTLHLTEDRDDVTWARGTITREDDRLVVNTLSLERADRLSDLVREVAPEARVVDEERRSPADLLGGDDEDDEDELTELELAELGEGGLLDEEGQLLDEGTGLLGEGSGLLDLDALPPEQRAAAEELLATFMRQQEDRWIDTPIPALGGATPREAAGDPTRRDQLVRLLDTFPSAAGPSMRAGRGMDADRLRDLLGLDR
jgi:hypothetical protein